MRARFRNQRRRDSFSPLPRKGGASRRRVVISRRRCSGFRRRLAKNHALSLGAHSRKPRDDDCHRADDDGHRQAVIAAEMRGKARLHGGIDRRQQIAELIDEAGKGRARVVGRQFVEMHRHHAPGALHRELHQERADRKPHRAIGKRP